MKCPMFELLVLAVAISTSCLAINDGTLLSKAADFKVLDVDSKTLEQSVLQTKTGEGDEKTFFKVIDCVYHIAKYGLQRFLFECEPHLEQAIRYCKQKLNDNISKSELDSCHEMLAIIETERDMCSLRQNKTGDSSCVSVALIQSDDDQKQRPKPQAACSGWPQQKGKCAAGELYGQVPGNSLSMKCFPEPQNTRSNTWQISCSKFDFSSKILDSGSKIDTGDVLVQVFTLPIGQGDCNFIKCNAGKNVIVFDCGSRGANILQKQGIFQESIDYLLDGVEDLTILISHGHHDHYNKIKKYIFVKKLQVIVGGDLYGEKKRNGKKSDYPIWFENDAHAKQIAKTFGANLSKA